MSLEHKPKKHHLGLQIAVDTFLDSEVSLLSFGPCTIRVTLLGAEQSKGSRSQTDVQTNNFKNLTYNIKTGGWKPSLSQMIKHILVLETAWF